MPYNIGVTTTADVLLNHGAVPASRLDGSSYADARLLARHPDTDIPGSPADDRAMADDVGTPAGEAARLRLSLKNAKTNKKHTSFFKAIKAGGRIGAAKWCQAAHVSEDHFRVAHAAKACWGLWRSGGE